MNALFNHLVNIAAWTCAIATVLWQRILLPLISRYTPEFLELLQPPPRPALAYGEIIILRPVTPELTPEPNQPTPLAKPRRRRKSIPQSPA